MAKSVDDYLSKGYDRRMAEYFAAGRRRAIGVTANDDFTLIIEFDNGEKRLFNAAPILQPGTVFAPFMQIENFRRVYVDDCHCIAWDVDPDVDSSVVWNNKVDLSPDTCYVDSVPLEGGTLHA